MGKNRVRKRPAEPFRTPKEIEAYFAGATIECLICGARFGRLGAHIKAKHRIDVEDYKLQFGLPWTRGLTSATSAANSSWTAERKANSRAIALKTRFYKLGPDAKRRRPAPFLKIQALQNLGIDPKAFDQRFARRVRALYDKGASDRQIAAALKAGSSTVNRLTKWWRLKERRRT